MADPPKVYTRTGDDGTTGLLFGGRVAKDHGRIAANGDIDEAQAAIGMARAQCDPGSSVDEMLVALERDLWMLMAEVATAPDNLHKLADDRRVSAEMVTALEHHIDEVTSWFPPLREFAVPGQSPRAAAFDLARTVVRRAERSTLPVAVDGAHVVAYLNRLSDLMWALARWADGDTLTARGDRAPHTS